MNFKWILFIIFIGLIGCSTSQTVSKGTVSHTPGGINSGQGLWYSLPKTVIQVEMIAEKVVVKPGPFFRFSQRLLNITNVETENREEWRIVGANISTYGIPDEKRMFRVFTEGNPSVAALNLTSNGILAGVNLAGYRAPEKKENEKVKVITLADVTFNNVPFTEEQLIKTSTAAMAEEVAKEIYRLRQLRNQFLRGELESLPPDKGAYKMALDEIANQEKAYMELFVGKVEVQTVKQYFDFVPEANQNLNTVLLRFSHQNGFLDPMDVSGTPVYIEVDADTRQYRNFVSEETSKTQNATGLVYCKPVAAEVKIIDRTLLLTSKDVQLSQFGQVLRLPADLLNDRGVGVEMDVNTGAIRTIFYK